jgi:hypothetical protein
MSAPDPALSARSSRILSTGGSLSIAHIEVHGNTVQSKRRNTQVISVLLLAQLRRVNCKFKFKKYIRRIVLLCARQTHMDMPPIQRALESVPSHRVQGDALVNGTVNAQDIEGTLQTISAVRDARRTRTGSRRRTSWQTPRGLHRRTLCTIYLPAYEGIRESLPRRTRRRWALVLEREKLE